MNRLKSLFSQLDKKDTKYIKIYEGPKYDPLTNTQVYEPIYWNDEVGYRFERTHKTTTSKPCINIMIPKFKLKVADSRGDIALCDYVLRKFSENIKELNQEIENKNKTYIENGYFYIFQPNTEIHERNTCFFESYGSNDYISIKICVQLPLHEHKKASRMICNMLTSEVELFISEFDIDDLQEAMKVYEKQNQIREWLKSSDYCAFVANGSLLVEGDNRNVIPFIAPQENEIEILGLKGMGIKRGVTIFTGGGYSGKSTLLEAIASGIYNHIKEHGKKYVITDESAVTITAEDGRSIRKTNISPFVSEISGVNVKSFDTDKASGSTSQAANIMESIHSGSKLLLIDEDKSATNFMIRDAVMREIVIDEPITPFVERVKQIYNDKKVSSIIVVGGSSEFFSGADNIILMKKYVASNITDMAKKKVNELGYSYKVDVKPTEWDYKKTIMVDGFTSYQAKKKQEVVDISELRIVKIGEEVIDARHLHNVTSLAQLYAIVFVVRKIQMMIMGSEGKELCLLEKIDEVYQNIGEKGVDSIYSTTFLGERWLEMPRKIDVLLFINRMRHIVVDNNGV